jgi:dihydroflavonol-4-reductase
LNLVTGATGLVGSHVALELLLQNKPVVALKRTTSDISKVEKLFSYYTPNYKELFQKIKWVEGDLSDYLNLIEILKEIKTVYHCAGYISFNENEEKKLFKINKEGTANMVNACLESNTEAFCFVSSIAALQNQDITNNIDEKVFWKPGPYQNSYSTSKYLAEQEVWRAAEEGLNVVIVNPGIILGPGFWEQGSGELFSMSKKGIKFYTEGITGYISAQDVAKSMIALTENKKFKERFILIENNYSFKEILFSIHKNFNKTLPTINAGKTLLKLARFFSFLLPTRAKISKSIAHAALNKNYFSNKKLLENLDFKLTPINDCISFTCKSFLKEKANKG